MGHLARATAVALLLPAVAGAAPRGPDGPSFYAPAPTPGPVGSVVWERPADPLVAVPTAARTTTVVYRSRAITGAPAVMSASVAFPRTDPPRQGWPVVVWNHVTTGAADACAPSRVTADSSEREKMTRGDAIVRRLAAAGLVVVRPDYEGLGTPGPHPYLVGRSLARSARDAFRAARDLDPRVGRRWVVAGHSEGGQAALFTGVGGHDAVPGTELRGVVAMAPPTHLSDLFRLGPLIPVTGPGINELSALAGLVLGGAQQDEPRLAQLYAAGALSPAANALLPHLEDRCHLDLGKADSWGGLAPAQVPGPRADDASPLLHATLDRNDPRSAPVPPDLPVRIDQGLADPVVPFAFTEELVLTLRRRGVPVTYQRHPLATHQDVTADGQAAGPATRWIVDRLR